MAIARERVALPRTCLVANMVTSLGGPRTCVWGNQERQTGDYSRYKTSRLRGESVDNQETSPTLRSRALEDEGMWKKN